jgi:hypothetical protein
MRMKPRNPAFRIACSCFGRGGFWLAGLGAASALALYGADAEAESTDAESDAEYRSWIELGVGGTFIDGDKAQFKQRTQLPQDAFGGIQSFHYEQDVGKDGIFKVDGRAMLDNSDFELRFELANPKKGFFKGGFREYRTWYDGSGGYYPGTGDWFSLYDEELHVDRGEFWFEAGLTLPKWPSLTVRYTQQYREGTKDSTIWGDAALPGITTGSPVRGIVPSFYDLDERRHILEADASHTFGKTGVGLGLRYDVGDNDNGRVILRRPGETSSRSVRQQEEVSFDLFNVHAFTETRFNDEVRLTTGYSYTTMDTDLSGSRVYGSGFEPVYDPAFARRQFTDAGFLSLAGGSRWDQYLMNVNLMFTPIDHLSIVPSLKVEYQDQESSSQFVDTFVDGPPTLSTIETPTMAQSDRGLLDVSGGLEARWTGLTNWVFYARGLWVNGQGDLSEKETLLPTGVDNLVRDTDFDRLTQKYTLGVNWYPRRRLNVAAQYYHKTRDNDYDHLTDSTTGVGGDAYPAFIRNQDFTTDDVNFRVTWRPLNNLTAVTRYDLQWSTIDTTGEGLGAQESSEMVSHILSESLTWSPLARWYLQGSISYVIDTTETPASELGGVTTGLFGDARNGYWNASLATGYALDEKTDLQAQYFYYRADNYEGTGVVGVPYGAGAQEQGISAAVIRRLTQRMQLTLRYGFFTNRDQTSGHYNDYDAHLVYSSLLFRF